MDYGYDEEGRRTHSGDVAGAARRRSNGRAHSSSSASSAGSSARIGTHRHAHPARRRGAHARLHAGSDADDALPVHGSTDDNDDDDDASESGSSQQQQRQRRSASSNSSDLSGESAPQSRRSSSSSDFSDDVELIVGETGAQSIEEPLVAASQIYPSSRAAQFAAVPHTRRIESAPASRPGGGRGPLLLASAAASRVGDAAATHGPTRLDYVCTLARIPARLKSLVFLGALHHGKTSLLHMLLGSEQGSNNNSHSAMRERSDDDYYDGVHKEGKMGIKYAGYVLDSDERARGMTLRSHVITATVSGARRQPQSHLLTCIDTPGHADFAAEACAAARLADVAVFCVDAVESLSESGEWLLRHAVLHEQLPIVLVITKIDRLILELKLPPLDAYRKLRGIIDTVNNIIVSCGQEVAQELNRNTSSSGGGGNSSNSANKADTHPFSASADAAGFSASSRTEGVSLAHANDAGEDVEGSSSLSRSRSARRMVVCPENGTVCFASARLGVFFTLETFARRYLSAYGESPHTEQAEQSAPNSGTGRNAGSRAAPREEQYAHGAHRGAGGRRCGAVSEDSVATLTRQLWGAITFENGRFIPLKRVTQRPSFVTWVLEPIYKVISHAMSGSDEALVDPINGAVRVTRPHSPLAAARRAVQRILTATDENNSDNTSGIFYRPHGNDSKRGGSDATRAVVEEAWDVLLDVVHPTEIMHRRLAWLQSHYGLCALRSACDDTEESTNGGRSTGNCSRACDSAASDGGGAIAIGTMMRRVGNEVVAVVRVVKGTLRCTAQKSHSDTNSTEHKKKHKASDINKEDGGEDNVEPVSMLSSERDGDDEVGTANRVILYHALANEADPFHRAHITGLFLSLSHSSAQMPASARHGSSGAGSRAASRGGLYDDKEDGEHALLQAVRESTSTDDSCEAVRRGEWVRVSEAHVGQLVYVTGLDKGESSHFVLVSGSAAGADGIIWDHIASSGTNNIDGKGDGGDELACNGNKNGKRTSKFGKTEWEEAMEPKTYPLGCPEPRLHVSLELKEPQKLTQLQESLRTLLSCSAGLDVHTEETGEINLTGYGELHLDSALYTLRHSLCRGVAVGLSQPYVSFRETVLEEFGSEGGGVLAMSGTRRCGVGCVSGRLHAGLTEALEYGLLDITSATPVRAHSARQDASRDKDSLGFIQTNNSSINMYDNYNHNNNNVVNKRTMRLWSVLRRDYQLDALAAQSIVGRGPDKTHGSSLLFDDTLPEEQRSNRGAAQLTSVHWNTLLTGFRAAMASGPLVAERVHGVGVRVIYVDATGDDARSSAAAVNSSAGAHTFSAATLLASTRAAVRQSLLGARPRLLEPVLAVEIVCPEEVVPSLTAILQMRRGTVTGEEPIAATPLVRVRALVPAMDSLGLETQVRVTTHGQALPSFRFAHWDRVPGDPFDASIQVAPLEPAKGFELSRDFVLKTRFRKGLPLNLMAEL